MLVEYKGAVFTSCPQLAKSRVPWLWFLPRESLGLHHQSLGWNANTGATAVNLALLLGAKRIFLLGFDMKLSKDGKANWHQNTLDKPDSGIYETKFIPGFERLQKDLEKKFPGKEIINITDDSALNLFPKVKVNDFWKERIAS